MNLLEVYGLGQDTLTGDPRADEILSTELSDEELRAVTDVARKFGHRRLREYVDRVFDHVRGSAVFRQGYRPDPRMIHAIFGDVRPEPGILRGVSWNTSWGHPERWKRKIGQIVPVKLSERRALPWTRDRQFAEYFASGWTKPELMGMIHPGAGMIMSLSDPGDAEVIVPFFDEWPSWLSKYHHAVNPQTGKPVEQGGSGYHHSECVLLMSNYSIRVESVDQDENQMRRTRKWAKYSNSI